MAHHPEAPGKALSGVIGAATRTTMDFRLHDTIAVLERTPRVLEVLLADLADEWIDGNEGPDTFSPFEVVGHLLHGERTDWIPRARMILAQQPGTRFEPFDRFGHRIESEGKGLGELLATFRALRMENLATLRAWELGDRQLALRGEHPELGGVTLAQLLATWAVHDLTHIAQIARTMARQYQDAVGPWRRYFRQLEWPNIA